MKPRIAMIIAGVVMVVGLIAYGLYYQLGFFVTSTSPRNNDQQAASSSRVVIAFNKKLGGASAASFDIQPRVPGKLSIEGNRLVFTPYNSLVIGTEYTVTLNAPISIDSKSAKPVKFKFRATYIEFKNLPKQEKEAQIEQSDSLEKSYPIVRSIPHETLEYKIDYIIDSNDQLVLKISLYAILNKPEQRGEYLKQLAEYKVKALDYLRSKGEDPGKYTIEYLPAEAKDL